MKKIPAIVMFHLAIILFILSLTSTFITPPAWSGPGDKVDAKESNEKRLVDPGVKPKSEKKGSSKVKKKAVKNAGKAAAAGVVTKKVTSSVNNDGTDSQE